MAAVRQRAPHNTTHTTRLT